MVFGYNRLKNLTNSITGFGFNIDEKSNQVEKKSSKKTLMNNLTGGKKDFSAPKVNTGQLKKTSERQVGGAPIANQGVKAMNLAREEVTGTMSAIKDDGKKAAASALEHDKEAKTGVEDTLSNDDVVSSDPASLMIQALLPNAIGAAVSKVFAGIVIKKQMVNYADSAATIIADSGPISQNSKVGQRRVAQLEDAMRENAAHENTKKNQEIGYGSDLVHNQGGKMNAKAHHGVVAALDDGYKVDKDILNVDWNDPKNIKEYQDLETSLANIEETTQHLRGVIGTAKSKGIRDDAKDEASISVAAEFNALGIQEQSGGLNYIRGVKIGLADLTTPNGELAFQNKALVQDELQQSSAQNNKELDAGRLPLDFTKQPLVAVS